MSAYETRSNGSSTLTIDSTRLLRLVVLVMVNKQKKGLTSHE